MYRQMKRLLTTYLIIMSSIIRAQDIHFSQITRASYQINPGMVGCFDGNIKVDLNWKDQWNTLDNAFNTYGTSFEYTFGKGNFEPKNVYYGIGAHVNRDVSGDVQLGNTNFGATFSTLVKVTDHSRLSMGVQGNVSSISINTYNMQWGSQYNGLNYDPTMSSSESIAYSPFNTADVSFGLNYWYFKKDESFYTDIPQQGNVGFALYHLNKPKYYFTTGTEDQRLPIRFVLHGDYMLKLNEKLILIPNVNYMKQSIHNEFIIGSKLRYNLKNSAKLSGLAQEAIITTGLDFRFTNVVDAVIPSLYLSYSSFSFGVSYDVNISRLYPASNFRGGLEFSLRFVNSDSYSYKNPLKPASSL